MQELLKKSLWREIVCQLFYCWLHITPHPWGEAWDPHFLGSLASYISTWTLLRGATYSNSGETRSSLQPPATGRENVKKIPIEDFAGCFLGECLWVTWEWKAMKITGKSFSVCPGLSELLNQLHPPPYPTFASTAPPTVSLVSNSLIYILSSEKKKKT